MHVIIFSIISVTHKERSWYKCVIEKFIYVFLFLQNIYSWNFIWGCISLAFLHFVYLLCRTAFGRYSSKCNPVVNGFF